MSSVGILNYAKTPGADISAIHDGGGRRLTDKTNGVFSALVTKTDGNKIFLKTQGGTDFSVNTASVAGGNDIKPGDELHFELVGAKGASVMLRQVTPRGTAQNQILQQHKDKDLARLMLEADFTSAEGNVFAGKSDEERQTDREMQAAQALSRIRRELAFASRSAGRNAIRELLSAGMCLENIDLSTLSSVTREVSQRLNSGAETGALSEDLTRRVFKSLEIDKNSALELIRSGKAITIDNIYMARSGGRNDRLNDAALDAVMPDIERLLKEMGLEPNDENTKAARELVSTGIELNADNIEKYKLLDSLKNINKEELIQYISGQLKDGKSLGDIELFSAMLEQESEKQKLRESYNELAEVLPKIGPDCVDSLVQRDKPVTLWALKQVYFFPLKTLASAEDNSMEALRQKKLFAELQLKLTSDNMGMLVNKRINIEYMSLKNALDEIKALESERYAALLNESGSEASESNEAQMTEIFDSVKHFAGMSEHSYGAIIRREINFELSAIAASVKTKSVVSSYEENLTRLNAKHGDSFETVSGKFGELLKKLGIGVSPENIRAAKILSRNGMDINSESIAEVRLIDNKLDFINDRLHPRIAAKMVSNGINVLDMNIDHVIAFIEEFNGQFGENPQDRLAKNISEVINDKNVTSDERNAIIAVYRLLHCIQKNGLASVGSVLKADKQLTFGNLLNGAKQFADKRGINKTVGLEYDEKNISENSISAAIERGAAFRYNERMLSEFAQLADNSGLKQLLRNEDSRNMLLDEVNALLNTAQKTGRSLDELVRKAESMKDIAPNLLRFIYENNMTVSYSSLEAVKMIASGHGSAARRLGAVRAALDKDGGSVNASAEIDSLFAENDAEGLERAVSRSLCDGLGNLVDILIGEEKYSALHEINEARPVFAALDSLKKNGSYIIPIKFNGKAAEIDMYVLNENLNEDRAKILLSLDAGGLGRISAALSVNGENAEVNVFCEDSVVMALVAENKDLMKEIISRRGFEGAEVSTGLSGLDHSLPARANRRTAPDRRPDKTKTDAIVREGLPPKLAEAVLGFTEYLETVENKL